MTEGVARSPGAGRPVGGPTSTDGSRSSTFRAAWELPPTRSAVAQGRHLVADTLAAWGLDGLVCDAQLLASELITNAVDHAASPAAITLEYDEGVLRIGVRDRAERSIVLRPPTESGGWGLRLVAALSRSWGEVHDGAEGKEVWCTLDLERPAEVPPIR